MDSSKLSCVAPKKRALMVRLGLLCFRKPRFCLLLTLLSVLGCLGLTYSKLTLELDWVYLFSPSDPYVQKVKQHRLDFPAARDIAIIVEGGSPERRRAFLDRLAKRLQSEPETFRNVFHKIDLNFVRTSALYYLPLEQLKTTLAEFEWVMPYLRIYSKEGHLEDCLQQFIVDLRGHRKNRERASMALLLGNELLLELKASLQSRGRGEIGRRLKQKLLQGAPVETESILRGETTLYNTIAAGRIHLLLVKPTGPRESLPHAAVSVARLRTILAELVPEYHAIKVRLGGAPVLRADERITTSRDSFQATLVSVLLVSALYGLAFSGELRRPAMSMFTLMVGLCWTLGYTTVVLGHLNFITVSLMAILAGLGIDFGIHLTFRYFEERRISEPDQALALTLAGTGSDAGAGALATAAAFGVMGPAGFRGIGELGLLAGGGVVLCFIATVTVLPALLSLHERKHPEPKPPARSTMLKGLEEGMLAYRRWVVVSALLFSLWCAVRVNTVGFDYNLLRMQDPTLESIQTEIRMSGEGNSTVIPAVSVAPTVEEARSRLERFKELDTVARAHSVVELIPDQVEAKTPLVKRFIEDAKEVKLKQHPLRRGAKRLLELAGSLEELEAALDYLERSLSDGSDPALKAELKAFRGNLEAVKSLVDSLGPGSIEDGLLAMEKSLTRDLGMGFSLLKEQNTQPATLETIPENLKVRFVGKDGQIATMVFARRNLWERRPLEALIQQLRTVDPEIMGEPTLMLHFGDVVVDSHRHIGWYAFAAVLLVLLIHLRSVKILLLALLPTSLSVLWLFGLMSLTRQSFSAANFIALPMLVGIGCIFGVHVIHRIVEEGRPSVLTLSTGPAVLLSALTTMAGFGSLMSVHHRGMASLGFVITVGVAANLVAALIVLPCLSYREPEEPTAPPTRPDRD